jgi:acetyl-CoA carboxylase carboxyl transferase subunit alpha
MSLPDKRIADPSDQTDSEITPFEKVLLARHERRPYMMDFVDLVFRNFQEVHGDRKFRDDPALVAGFATLRSIPVALIGHQKGRNVRDRQIRNFGMPKPDGYRKALRVMQMAEKFNRPLITLIDTPGAYPGIDAEERGQAEAIAVNLREMARLRIPVIVVITGEGGSGGALAIGIGDIICMLENAVYSVITPEGCAAILWKDASLAVQASESLRLTAKDLNKLGVIDMIIREPDGGAQENWQEMAHNLESFLYETIFQIKDMPVNERLKHRFKKLRILGQYTLL